MQLANSLLDGWHRRHIEWLQGANRGGDGCLDMVPRPHPGIQGTCVLPEDVCESQQKKFRDHVGAGETAPRDVVNLNYLVHGPWGVCALRTSPHQARPPATSSTPTTIGLLSEAQ